MSPLFQAVSATKTMQVVLDCAHTHTLQVLIPLSWHTLCLSINCCASTVQRDLPNSQERCVCLDCSVLRGCQEVEQAALADVIAVRERDPACTAYSSALLYYKGYHALQTHRIAHGLWERGQRVLARSLQVKQQI